MTQEEVTQEAVGYQLKRAQAALHGRMDDVLRPLGLTTPQYVCLNTLRQMPGISTAELARRGFVTRQTTNVLVRSLTDKGLVERSDTPTGGRSLPVSLTNRGRKLLAEASELVLEVQDQMISGLTAKEVANLGRALAACADALDA